jgi:hypothetical protein
MTLENAGTDDFSGVYLSRLDYVEQISGQNKLANYLLNPARR